jgi:hypothetical protein
MRRKAFINNQFTKYYWFVNLKTNFYVVMISFPSNQGGWTNAQRQILLKLAGADLPVCGIDLLDGGFDILHDAVIK